MLLPHSAHSFNWVDGNPDWDYTSRFTGIRNYIPDTSTSSHVTAIDLGLAAGDAIFTVNIIGDGILRSPAPNPAGCSTMSGRIHTIIIEASERVTKIEAWRNNIDFLWYRIKLTLNTG